MDTKRKVIQVAPYHNGEFSPGIVALCNDGELFHFSFSEINGKNWQRFPPIPQDECVEITQTTPTT